MMRKEVSFMKKKGAPKSMIKHEESEMKGKKMPKFAAGGAMNLGVALKNYAKSGTPLPAAYSKYQKYADMQKRKFGTVTPRPAPPSGGAAMPVSGMDAAGGTTQTMMRKGGSVFRKAADGKAHKGKTKGTMVKMAMGGMTPSTPPKKPVTLQTRQFGTGPGMRPMPKHLGKAVTDRGKAILGKASGGIIGSFRRAADGVASKGKTKGKMVKMAYGGKC